MRKCIIGAVSARTTDVVTGLTTTVLRMEQRRRRFEGTLVKLRRGFARNGCRNESWTGVLIRRCHRTEQPTACVMWPREGGRGHSTIGSRMQPDRCSTDVIGEVGVARLLRMLVSCNDDLVASGVLL